MEEQKSVDGVATVSTIAQVEAFHRAFGVAVGEKPELPETRGIERSECAGMAQRMLALANRLHAASEVYTIKGTGTIFLRLQLLQEEVGELAEAFAEGDIVAVLDALTDIQYVLDGCYLACGLQGVKDAAFAEVQRSNMTKLDAQGNPVINAAGRVVKSDQYSPPKLEQFLP